MGKRGPAALPEQVLKLRGSVRTAKCFRPGKRPEGIPDSGNDSPPIPLGPEALEIWHRTLKILRGLSLLKDSDRPAIAKYADMHATWDQCRRFLNENGHVFVKKDENGDITMSKRHEESRVYLTLAPLLLKFEAEFGMTPCGRERFATGTVQKPAQETGKDRHFKTAL